VRRCGVRIRVLRSSYEGSVSEVADLDPLPDPTPWLAGHEVTLHDLRKEDAAAEVARLVAEGCDVFVNLCDGLPYEDLAGVEVVAALEAAGATFTGPTSALFTLTKEQMKHRAVELGVRTPAFAFARTEADLERAARSLATPAIVKHIDGWGSVGMTAASRVTDADALVARGREMLALAGGALIEEFIEGDEYSVLVVEGRGALGCWVPAPVACRFPPGETFKHFDLKWRSFEGLAWGPCDDPALRAELARVTRVVFEGIGCVSYARCDFRVDAEGRAWFLEVNTSCGIFYPPGAEGCADHILLREPGGHAELVARILDAALERRGRQR
jgi:D-alanine-D-alanine ligase